MSRTRQDIERDPKATNDSIVIELLLDIRDAVTKPEDKPKAKK